MSAKYKPGDVLRERYTLNDNISSYYLRRILRVEEPNIDLYLLEEYGVNGYMGESQWVINEYDYSRHTKVDESEWYLTVMKGKYEYIQNR